MNSTFPALLKLAKVTLAHKKGTKSCKDHYRRMSMLSNISLTYMREYYLNKWLNILIQSSKNTTLALGKVIVHREL